MTHVKMEERLNCALHERAPSSVRAVKKIYINCHTCIRIIHYMYVCMYACMHVCMYVCMYIYVHVYIHTHIHI